MTNEGVQCAPPDPTCEKTARVPHKRTALISSRASPWSICISRSAAVSSRSCRSASLEQLAQPTGPCGFDARHRPRGVAFGACCFDAALDRAPSPPLPLFAATEAHEQHLLGVAQPFGARRREHRANSGLGGGEQQRVAREPEELLCAKVADEDLEQGLGEVGRRADARGRRAAVAVGQEGLECTEGDAEQLERRRRAVAACGGAYEQRDSSELGGERARARVRAARRLEGLARGRCGSEHRVLPLEDRARVQHAPTLRDQRAMQVGPRCALEHDDHAPRLRLEPPTA
eukprot:6271217-Prymnesium_polylepis.1